MTLNKTRSYRARRRRGNVRRRKRLYRRKIYRQQKQLSRIRTRTFGSHPGTRNNRINVSFHDYHYYNLDLTDTLPASASNSNAVCFRANVIGRPMKNGLATNYCSLYKFVKMNYIKCYFTAFAITYQQQYKPTQPPDADVYAVGVNSFLGQVPFFLTWDIDGFYGTRVTPQKYTDDPHARKLYVGSKKAATFHYHIPVPLRRYLPSQKVVLQPWDSKNFHDCLKDLTGVESFRCPLYFNGGLDDVWTNLHLPSVSHVIPVSIALVLNMYVNCSFIGRNGI